MQCDPRKEGPCANCQRRYPPVQCFVPDIDDAIPLRGCKNPEDTTFPSRQGFDSTSSWFQPEHISTKLSSELEAYPHNPLSRILSSTRDPYQYYDALRTASGATSRYIDDSLTHGQAESIIEVDPGQDDQATPSERRLQYLDSGEAIYSRVGSPRTIGGVLSMLNTMHTIPIKTTSRNTELFHFCKFLVPSHHAYSPTSYI